MELDKKIDSLSRDIIESTQKLLKIKSVEDKPLPGMSFGEGVNNALKAALEISKELGFNTVNIDGYIGYAEVGEGEDYVGILGHLDVVPEGNGWRYPPYAAEIHDGKIYARGAIDDKGPIVAALYGLKAIRESNLTLSKRVRIIFGTNEESGCKEIEYYLKKEKPPVSGFTPDAGFPMIFAEKGRTIFKLIKDLKVKPNDNIKIKYIKGGTKVNMVPDYAEAYIETNHTEIIEASLKGYAEKSNYDLKIEIKDSGAIIKSYGVAAHGGMPSLGKNAIMQLLKFIETLDIKQSDLFETITFLNEHIGLETDGKSFGVSLKDKELGELTFNVGIIEVNEYKFTLVLNLRYPVTFTFEDLNVPLNERIKGTGIRIEDMVNANPLFFPLDHPLIRTLQKVYVEQTGLDPTPIAIGGGTYANTMPNIVAFGPGLPGKQVLAHQVDEFIEVEDLIKVSKIYAHAIYELAK